MISSSKQFIYFKKMISVFIMCGILAANLDPVLWGVTSKVPANKSKIRESGNLVLQERLCICYQQ
jgi:hypothetical protein